MTRFETIWVPVDFSDHSREALDTAVPSGKLIVLAWVVLEKQQGNAIAAPARRPAEAASSRTRTAPTQTTAVKRRSSTRKMRAHESISGSARSSCVLLRMKPRRRRLFPMLIGVNRGPPMSRQTSECRDLSARHKRADTIAVGISAMIPTLRTTVRPVTSISRSTLGHSPATRGSGKGEEDIEVLLDESLHGTMHVAPHSAAALPPAPKSSENVVLGPCSTTPMKPSTPAPRTSPI